jgi:periplasmic protein TonB
MSVNRRHWQSLAVALGLESLLIVGTFIWAGQHTSPIDREVIPLTLEMAEVPVPEKKPAPPEVPKTEPTPKIQPKSAPTPPSAAAPKVQTVLNDTPAPAATKAEPPGTTTPSAPAPAVAAPAAPAAVDPALAYNIKLAAAVQAAFEVPGSAKALSFKGRARMEFSLHDGKVSAIRVLQSSGLSAVDRAATKAVEMASYPLPPAGLQNKEGVYQIWVACY